MSRSPKPRLPTVIRYHLPDGTRCRKDTPGAVRTKTKGDTYVVSLTIDGKRKTVSLGTTDYATACVEMRKRQKREADRAAGIRDDYHDHAERPLAEHVRDWSAVLANKGTAAKQVKTSSSRVRKLASVAGWARITDVTADGCLEALRKLRTEDDLSAQTRNHYLAAAKAFVRWLSSGAVKRLRDNPLSGLLPISVESDRRHDRRCPTDEEVSKLFAWLATGRPGPGGKWHFPKDGTAPVLCHMTGPQRAMGYKVCMATGFRAGELKVLVRESFDLDAGTVSVRAGYSKRRRKDTQDLPAWLVTELREWFGSGGGLWGGFAHPHPGRILQRDLAAAGVEYVIQSPDGPLYFDFHALRVWYATALANQPGISIKTLMEMMRHSDPALTLAIYAKAKRQDVKAAANAIPDPSKKSG